MRNNKSKNGFVEWGLVLGIAIMSMAALMWVKMENRQTKHNTARLAADQFIDVLDAAEQYIEVNSATILSTASDTQAFIATGDDIQLAGYLPSNWNSVNAWGQNYRLYVVEPSSGTLQGYLVTTGGSSTSDDSAFEQFVIDAATIAGSRAGFVPGSDVVPGQSSDILQGNSGAWTFDTTAISNFDSPGGGHLAGMISPSTSGSATSAQDYLYRVSVPGSPELNQMQTDLDMDGNDITMGGGAITETDHIQLISRVEADFSCAAGQENVLYIDPTAGLFVCRDGNRQMIYDTGNLALSSVPVGSVIAWPSSSLPPLENGEQKWAECDGSAFAQAAYPELFAQLGTTTLPDYRGEFLRGWDNGRGVDPGRGIGTSQGDAIRNIEGDIYGNSYRLLDGHHVTTGPFYTRSSAARGCYAFSGGGTNPSGAFGFDASRQVPTADENRPVNVSVVWLIRILP